MYVHFSIHDFKYYKDNFEQQYSKMFLYVFMLHYTFVNLLFTITTIIIIYVVISHIFNLYDIYMIAFTYLHITVYHIEYYFYIKTNCSTIMKNWKGCEAIWLTRMEKWAWFYEQGMCLSSLPFRIKKCLKIQNTSDTHRFPNRKNCLSLLNIRYLNSVMGKTYAKLI